MSNEQKYSWEDLLPIVRGTHLNDESGRFVDLVPESIEVIEMKFWGRSTFLTISKSFDLAYVTCPNWSEYWWWRIVIFEPSGGSKHAHPNQQWLGALPNVLPLDRLPRYSRKGIHGKRLDTLVSLQTLLINVFIIGDHSWDGSWWGNSPGLLIDFVHSWC